MFAPQTPPCKTAIAAMEPFGGLGLEDILVVTNARQADIAHEELMRSGTVGFDTEAKPTFHKGEKSEGPHVLQFATLERAFIFQTCFEETHRVIVELLGSDSLTKIGFGLSGDLRQISNRFGLRPAAIVDLDRTFRKLGFRNAVGAKSAIAMLFNRRLSKSKTVTMSNWASRRLSKRQLIYAANDAYAAIKTHHALLDKRAAEDACRVSPNTEA